MIRIQGPRFTASVFTYYTCGTSNPYLIVTVKEQQVPIVDPATRLNLSTRAFAINTWAEIAYQDPTNPKYTFRIAEDLIYDINNDTFAVAAPFDVKGGRQQVSGVSSVGPNTTVTAGPGSSEEDSDVYNIKFTFLATPLAKQAPLKPTEGVTRITGGQLGDDGVYDRATEAFTELVARLYFNVLTAALGSDCDPGYPELAPAAKLMQTRLRRLMPGNSSYHGMPLTETLLSDKNGSLCIQEANTLYQDLDPSCNAWTFCSSRTGCRDGNSTKEVQSVGTCSLYFEPGLLYNYPMDNDNGTLRGPDVNYTSGRTLPVLPSNIMSLLVPIEGTSDHQMDEIQTFSKVITPSPAAQALEYIRAALFALQT
ncbi:hypothetical protein COCSUDRAFT_40894 [Coccomyxa subellipsoidea C-169]|uniref:Uncharacterized protein n=1 Tax=Coccomyxa subellipsoidea (strain C-169) TaxID=574566 RepID=I0Z1J7_COCSC|nr:hypothetical protein COCSUDRAFT_40894 [Coccomyxa subellipsoidea C-169]EIE24516.1 hypothetical protein COCSUDRAFT_40894 [Coccomyxa subellipsoidea C-169]|eukprot:XP_005649060.1 hypothetical protein COCSUDRAFT_40894 [Coccomyxa subellipsoidea C-169]